MDDFDQANRIVKSIRDADANDNNSLADALRAELAEINKRLAAAGFAPIES